MYIKLNSSSPLVDVIFANTIPGRIVVLKDITASSNTNKTFHLNYTNGDVLKTVIPVANSTITLRSDFTAANSNVNKDVEITLSDALVGNEEIVLSIALETINVSQNI